MLATILFFALYEFAPQCKDAPTLESGMRCFGIALTVSTLVMNLLLVAAAVCAVRNRRKWGLVAWAMAFVLGLELSALAGHTTGAGDASWRPSGLLPAGGETRASSGARTARVLSAVSLLCLVLATALSPVGSRQWFVSVVLTGVASAGVVLFSHPPPQREEWAAAPLPYRKY